LSRIRMINFIFRLPVPTKFSLSVRCTWQASTGFCATADLKSAN
jgi:hypothetical protein